MLGEGLGLGLESWELAQGGGEAVGGVGVGGGVGGWVGRWGRGEGLGEVGLDFLVLGGGEFEGLEEVEEVLGVGVEEGVGDRLSLLV